MLYDKLDGDTASTINWNPLKISQIIEHILNSFRVEMQFPLRLKNDYSKLIIIELKH